PAPAQSLVQSDQVRSHRDLTLREQIFAFVKLPLSVKDRQKVHETRPIALSRQLNRRLASGDGVLKMVAPFLLEGIVDQGILCFLQRPKYCRAVAELGLRQARVLQQEGTKRDREEQPEILGAIARQHFESYQVHARVSCCHHEMMTIILQRKKNYGLPFCVGLASKADA